MIMREVTLVPSRPASGLSLTEKVIASVGGSIGVDGQRLGHFGRADGIGDGGLRRGRRWR